MIRTSTTGRSAQSRPSSPISPSDDGSAQCTSSIESSTGCASREAAERRRDRRVQPAAERLGLELLDARRRLAQGSRDERTTVVVQPPRRAPRLPRSSVGERPVGECGTVREATCVEPARPTLAGELSQLLREPRLADPRIAGDHEHGAALAIELVEGAVQNRDLGVTPYESDSLPLRVRALAEQPPGRHGLGLALQRQLADVLELEPALREPVGRVADVGLARRSGRLEPLGEVHRVAEHVVVQAHVTALDAGDRVPRVDADVQAEAVAVRQIHAEPFQLGVHLDCDRKGSLGVVLVADGCAEEREQRVARVLVDHPSYRPTTAQAGDQRIDHLDQLLGIEALGEAREAGDVGEERRDQPALVGELAARLHEACGHRACDEVLERLGGVLLGGHGLRGGAAAPAAVPHWPQNFVPAGFSVPHAPQLHGASAAVPH